MPHRRVVDGFYAAGADFYARRLAEVLEGGEAALRYTERRSSNRIVLVVLLLFVIESRFSVEDENEDDEEKFARRAKILRDSSTTPNPFSNVATRRARSKRDSSRP